MASRINSIKSDSFRVSGARLWSSKGDQGVVHVTVSSGKITEISSALTPKTSLIAGLKVIEASGLVLLPAGVDAQVHLRVPGQPQKETAMSGLWAAVHGGVGALLTMPNTKPVIDEPSVCELARRELKPAEEATGVRVLLSAAITKGQKGRELVDFDALAYSGVAAFTDDGVGVSSDELMLLALRGSARTGLPILQHAEVPGHGAVLAPGPIQQIVGGLAYDEKAETEMVARDLRLLEQVPGARYHVLHVSSAKTLNLVKTAINRGLNVTCEASPHHLYFSSEDISESNTSFKMNPPLRLPADRLALQLALASGDCHFMATDHAPHESEVKSVNFKTSAFGTTGLETSLRVMFWLWQRNLISVGRLVDAWAEYPANFLGIGREFGDLAVGKPLNAVLAAPSAPDCCVLASDLVGQSKNSCFIGSHLPGKLYTTFLGQWIHELID
ncbi:MAG: dihydroorotase [Proteobacteria bacterium]|nr:dihydroorotase [Pseudomonadota bacterium]